MKAHTLKLKLDECKLLKRLIEIAYFKHSEGKLIDNGFYHSALILSSLKTFFEKLIKASTFPYSGTKNFKLSVPELLSLYQFFEDNYTGIEPIQQDRLILRKIKNNIYEHGLTKGNYIMTDKLYTAREKLAKLAQSNKISATEMEDYIQNPEKLFNSTLLLEN